jgi:8-oxo-dGTP pyrophosphatase MutT (NUDIX family)
MDRMNWRAGVFRIISRTCIAAYRRFPIFGALRGAIAVVPYGDRYVMIERADGLGLCFPGGLVHPWESAEMALRREIEEETGMSVQRVENWFDYRDNDLYPTHIFVFHAEASGEPRSSWEGKAVIVNVAEMQSGILMSQREVVSRLSQTR